MIKKFIALVGVLVLMVNLVAFAQIAASNQPQSPKEFFGYELGQRFTPHHKLVDYAEHLAKYSDRVHLKYYGESYEQRPLFALFVTSAQNHDNLEEIRKDNLRRAGMLEGTPQTNIPIAWFSFNVHGNEAVGVETALMMLWKLLDPSESQSEAWLQEMVVVIDPCLNPDGHSRYVNWYAQRANKRLQVDPQSVEHAEPWPGGRPNHYLFDLNRDWAWQVQKETQERAVLYNAWLPQVHVDVHEQGVDAPYFFAPAADPIHDYVTEFQRKFQYVVGRGIAKEFDAQSWLYFTREDFDLFYPSYGDTWPTFNGAIGMTYEQAGSGRAGLGIVTSVGDTLTLRDRIDHHFTAVLSTVETVAANRQQLLDEFSKFFSSHQANPRGSFKSYVLKQGDSPARLNAVKALLVRNGIQYSTATAPSTARGYAYRSGKEEAFEVEEGDLVVSAHQPKSVLVQTLFEPHPNLPDSLTYDITSWAVPFAHGVQAYALPESSIGRNVSSPVRAAKNVNQGASIVIPSAYTTDSLSLNLAKPVAYIFAWNAAPHGKVLSALLDAKIRVRFATQDFKVDGRTFAAGALIVGREGNLKMENFDAVVKGIADKHQVQFVPVSTGFMESGRDFGSTAVRTLMAPKIAMLSGRGVSSLSFGELWHYVEAELDYPISILELERFSALDLAAYQVLIMPAGDYRALGDAGFQKLSTWVSNGGKLIAIESALESLVGKTGFEIASYLNEEEKKQADKRKEELGAKQRLMPTVERERARISQQISGAIYHVHVDASHPLGYGTGGTYTTLKNHANRYVYLKNGVNVGTIRSAADYRSGFVGNAVRNNVSESLVFGAQRQGRGQVIYFVDNPVFRGFWEQGKLILANALFFVGQ